MAFKKILILAAGTGGMIVANKLARDLRREIALGKVEITVLDKNNTYINQAGFTFLPFGIYTPGDITRSRSSLLSPRLKFKYGEDGEVARVDLKNRSVVVKSGKKYEYDYLVIATGVEFDVESVPGLEKDFNTFYTFEGAMKLRETVNHIEKGRIVINAVKMPISCPGAPGKFTIVLDDYLRYVRGENIRSNIELIFLWPIGNIGQPSYNVNIAEEFKKRKIELTYNFATAEIDPQAKEVVSGKGERVKYDLLITVPPHTGVKALRDSSITDEKGWIPADKNTLQYHRSLSEHFGEVYIVGDAGPTTIPKMGITTHYQSLNVAQNLINDVLGTGFRTPYRGEMGCPYLGSTYTTHTKGTAYIPVWTYNTRPPPFRPTELGWLLYRMYYYVYWDTTAKAIL